MDRPTWCYTEISVRNYCSQWYRHCYCCCCSCCCRCICARRCRCWSLCHLFRTFSFRDILLVSFCAENWKTCAQTNRMPTIDWVVRSRTLANYHSRANCIYCRPRLWSPERQRDNTVQSLEYIYRRIFPLLNTFHWFTQKCLSNAFPTLLNVSPLIWNAIHARPHILSRYEFFSFIKWHCAFSTWTLSTWTCTECRIKSHIDADVDTHSRLEMNEEQKSFDFMRRCYCCCRVLFSISEKVTRLLSNVMATHHMWICEMVATVAVKLLDITLYTNLCGRWIFEVFETQKMLSPFRHPNFEFQIWKKRIQINIFL